MRAADRRRRGGRCRVSAPSRPSPTSTRSCATSICGASSRAELRPHAREWEDARWFPDEVFTRMGELGFLGPQVPGGATAARAATTCTTRCSPRSSRAAARAGWRPASARTSDRHAADLEVRHRGPEAALPRARDRAARRSPRSGSPSPTPAPTSPGSGRTRDARSTAAGSSTARRRSSPTACARDFVVTAVKTTAGGRPPRHLVPDRRPRRPGVDGDEAREARLARVRHGADRLRRRRSCPRRTCSARSTRASS